MSWELRGTYVASCNCEVICGCSVDARPTGPEHECTGAAVFHVDRGELGGIDLSGVNFAMVNHFPDHVTAGNWTVGIIVDDRATDEQTDAIERIVSGREGGPFGEFVPLIGDYRGLERARILFADGKAPHATIGDRAELDFDGFYGPAGDPVTVSNAMLAFAPVYRPGKGRGYARDLFGFGFDPLHAETADFEFSSETAGEVHPRA